MPTRSRSNPLVLGVLTSFHEHPMYPYEVATQHRQRQKHETVRLNSGSLYGAVESLERRGLVEAQDTERAGRPERTVYRLTTAGRVEMRDWLTEPISAGQDRAVVAFDPAEVEGKRLSTRQVNNDIRPWRWSAAAVCGSKGRCSCLLSYLEAPDHLIPPPTLKSGSCGSRDLLHTAKAPLA